LAVRTAADFHQWLSGAMTRTLGHLATASCQGSQLAYNRNHLSSHCLLGINSGQNMSGWHG